MSRSLLWVICLVGCAHYDPVEVKVFSDPPGARIIDVKSNAYLCDAPCSIKIGKGSAGSQAKTTTVKAQPTRTQDCEQTITVSSDNVPAQVMFDMKVCPINRNLNGTMSGE